jgi:NADH:ubiquinone oxidoreductase subunit H
VRGNTRRLRVACEGVFFVLVLGVPIACASLLFGVHSFDGVVAGQGASPLTWSWLQRPTMLAALPLYLVAASRIQAHPTAPHDEAGFARAEQWITAAVLCALGVVLFAGGWQVPAALVRLPQARLLAAALFVLKAWSFAWLLARIRPLVRALRFSSLAVSCVVTPAFMAAWFWLEPAPLVELSMTRALASSLALVALVTWVRAATAPRPHGQARA